LMSYSKLENRLSLYNDFNHSIYFYELPEGNLAKKVSLEREGVNGVFRVSGFYYHSKDSIFTVNQYTKRVSILNDSGKKLEEFELFDVDDPGMPFSSSLFYHNGNVYFTVVGYKGTSKENEFKSLLIYNLKNKSKMFLIDTPVEYRGNWADRTVARYGVLISGTSYVNSWAMGDMLVALKLEDESVIESGIQSKNIQYPDQYKEDMRSTEKRLYYQRTNSWNIDLFYAPHQNIILRSVNIGSDIPVGEDFGSGDFLSQNGDRIFDIIELFDTELNKIGEVSSISFYGEIFSTEKGIYIADYQDRQDNEDIISFGIYKTVKQSEK